MTATGPDGRPPGGPSPTIWRRLFHLLAGSSIPLAGIFLPIVPTLAVVGALALASLTLDLARFRLAGLNRLFLNRLAPLLKPDEARRITGATYLLLSGFAAFLLFDQAIAVVAMLFLSLGDPAAALVGSRAPGPRLFGKSPGGTVALVAVGWLVVLVLVQAGVVQYHWGLPAAALIAGLVELTPIPVDDNLTIPLVSGAAMQIMTAW